jgi:hypothetical protein
VASVLNAIAPEDGTVPQSRALTVEARESLRARVNNLDGYLRGSMAEEIADDLVKLFVVLVPPKTDEAVDAGLRIRAYCGVLGDVPPFAVRRAIGDFMRGKVGNAKWAPTAPELRKEALKHAEPWIVERSRIMRALDAPVRPDDNPERSAQVMEHVRETLRQLRRPNAYEAARDAETRAEAERALREAEANPPPIPPLSEAGRRATGLPPVEPSPSQEGKPERPKDPVNG